MHTHLHTHTQTHPRTHTHTFSFSKRQLVTQSTTTDLSCASKYVLHVCARLHDAALPALHSPHTHAHTHDLLLKSQPATQVLCMGWLRSVGSIRIQVSFAEYRLFYRALLQKRPVILSILLVEATPWHNYRALSSSVCARRLGAGRPFLTHTRTRVLSFSKVSLLHRVVGKDEGRTVSSTACASATRR